MRILITGGAGFIGSHLAERLVEQGHSVIIMDNLSSGSRDNLTREGVEFLEWDITNPFDSNADWIFHLASMASPASFEKHALEIALTNSLGTLNTLKTAEKHGSRVLITSTSEVYGDPLIHPQSEDYRGNVATMGPRAPYDESKRFAETLAYIYHRRGVDVRLARIFNTYGPRMSPYDGRVIPNFITQALEGRPLTVYGDGQQTRSFCYIDDMVEGLLKLMTRENDDVRGIPINLGNPEEHTILELAKTILDLTGSSSPIVFKPQPPHDPKKGRPDITRAKTLLGWEPKTPLRGG
ncbi:MAG: UDP-glucuronic acid decarboxylase family protein [Thermoprotei archaeon]